MQGVSYAFEHFSHETLHLNCRHCTKWAACIWRVTGDFLGQISGCLSQQPQGIFLTSFVFGVESKFPSKLKAKSNRKTLNYRCQKNNNKISPNTVCMQTSCLNQDEFNKQTNNQVWKPSVDSSCLSTFWQPQKNWRNTSLTVMSCKYTQHFTHLQMWSTRLNTSRLINFSHKQS